MARKKKTEEPVPEQNPVIVTPEKKAEDELLAEVILHQSQSENYLATVRDTWDEKEAMLIGKLEDGLSKKTKNKVFDHRLSTIIFERAARVMAQNPKGRAFAVSVDDIGKNALMNLLLKFGVRMDNMQFSHLLKNRLMDLYSMVYGTMFELVFWMVNPKTGYIGPQTYIIPIRDAFPQPGVRNVNDMDWFIVRNTMTTVALKSLVQSKSPYWKTDNIARLLNDLKQKKFEGDKAQSKQNQRSYTERTLFPTEGTDAAFPQVECFTEYRAGLWITWTSQQIDSKTQRNYLLRVTDPGKPYDDMLPVVAKHCFPLLDSPIGLGEFERGKTLQYALNSLINLYLDGVKYSIFPPLAINPDNVVPQSIKWGAGERWFMNNPNQDVQPVNLSPRGIETFNQTYSFMLSALYNQAGTTEVSQSSKTESGLGKTPQAIRLQSVRESARDEWDRFMMEECLREVYRRFIALYANKQETDVTMRLFETEIKEIEKTSPDVMALVKKFKSGKRGQIKFNRSALGEKGRKGETNPVDWDYEQEAGSTVRPNLEADQENITSILKAVLENQGINEALAKQCKQVDLGELFRMWIKSANNPNIDVDKIIIPLTQADNGKNPAAPASAMPGSQDPNVPVDPAQIAAAMAAAGQGGAPAPAPAPTPAPEAAPAMTPEMMAAMASAGGAPATPATQAPGAPAPAPTVPGAPQFQDPAINEMVMAILGGRQGIPQQA